jgi:hypothetical protein
LSGRKRAEKKHRKKVKGNNFCKRRKKYAERENSKKLEGGLEHLFLEQIM